MRPTGMRALTLLLAGAAVVLAAGCGTPAPSSVPADHPSGADGTSPAVAASPSPSGAVPTRSAPPGGRPATPHRRPSPTAANSDPDMPRDLVGPPLVLTGTVHVGSRCVVLVVGAHRWALSGPQTAALSDGATVTVRGRPTSLPAGCDAERALSIQSVT